MTSRTHQTQIHVLHSDEGKRISFSQQMLDHLLGGGSFTGPQAYELFGVWSVASLIHGLRQKGWQIDSDRDGEFNRARYFMTRKTRLSGMSYDPIYRRGV